MENLAEEWEPTVMTIKDYKAVDGVAEPHHFAAYKESGEIIRELTLKEVKHNTGVDDAVFTAEAMSEK